MEVGACFLRYALYPFLSMDRFGSGRLIFVALMQDEIECSLRRMVRCFKESNPAWQNTETIIIDKDFGEVKVLRAAFPEARILLCIFHVLKSMRLKISTLQIDADEKTTLLEVVKKMLYAKSKDLFSEKVKEVEAISPEFQDYLDKNWMPNKEMWALHLRNCLTLGNNTNNRIESFNQKVKQVAGTSDTLATCIEKVLALNTATEQKLMFQLYQSECTSVAIKGHVQDATTAAFYALYTDYAAKLSCQQWATAKKANYRLKEVDNSAPAEKYVVMVGSDLQYQVSQDLTSCTCTFKKNYELPCRHILYIMKVKDAEPTELMAAERWRKAYQKTAILGSVPKSDVHPLLINNSAHRVAPQAMSRQQKYVKAKHHLLELASLMSEVGQTEFNERMEILNKLRTHWTAGRRVTVSTCEEDTALHSKTGEGNPLVDTSHPENEDENVQAEEAPATLPGFLQDGQELELDLSMFSAEGGSLEPKEPSHSDEQLKTVVLRTQKR